VQTLSELAPHTQRTFARCFDTATSVQQRARCLAWAFNHRISVWNPFEYAQPKYKETLYWQKQKQKDDVRQYPPIRPGPSLESQIGLALLQIIRQSKGEARPYNGDNDIQRVRGALPAI
jgi:hypothetical protein